MIQFFKDISATLAFSNVAEESLVLSKVVMMTGVFFNNQKT